MRCLVIGLGSMGKRRIRCLKALGYTDIIGFDTRSDRREEVRIKYSIPVADSYAEIDLKNISVIIISTPPDKHFNYCRDAISKRIPCFVEASVSLDDVKKTIELADTENSFVAPSCTLKFHRVIQAIKRIVDEGKYGAVTNFSYHCGQYLPDWHPWEDIRDYYVSNRETAGAREIVPFELTWLTDMLGFPVSVKGFFSETMDLGTKTDNTYSFVLKYPGFLGSMTVDVVSRFATRSLILNFEKGQVRWNWEDNFIRIYDSSKSEWEVIKGFEGKAEEGYNKNITEDMYIQEVRSFIDGIHNPELFPNSLKNDKKILELLKQIEDSDGGFSK
jgi:predicted dehydrogenase